MNETLACIMNRRSTRAFLPEQVKETELQAILQAGLHAPSAHNEQPWHFTVIQDQLLLAELNAGAKEVGKNANDALLRKMCSNEQLHIFYHAPTVIVVSGEEKAIMPKTDCAAAVENMLIAAESLGIGTCWIGLAMLAFQGEKAADYCRQLQIPDGYAPYYAVSLGYKKIAAVSAPPRREDTVNFLR